MRKRGEEDKENLRGAGTLTITGGCTLHGLRAHRGIVGMEVKGKVAQRWEDIAARKKIGTCLNLVPGVSQHLRGKNLAYFLQWCTSLTLCVCVCT